MEMCENFWKESLNLDAIDSHGNILSVEEILVEQDKRFHPALSIANSLTVLDVVRFFRATDGSNSEMNESNFYLPYSNTVVPILSLSLKCTWYF